MPEEPPDEPKRLHDVSAETGVEDEEPLSSFDRWVMPYLEDSALWPVLIVIIAHIVAFTAPVLLFAFRDRRFVGMAALLLMGFASVQAVRYDLGRRGRPAAITGLLTACWVLSSAAAYFASEWGLL